MLHDREVHIYPIINVADQRLIIAVVGYHTEQSFTVNIDNVGVPMIPGDELAKDVDDQTPLVILQDDDMAELLMTVATALDHDGLGPSLTFAQVDDDAIWLSCHYAQYPVDEEGDDYSDYEAACGFVWLETTVAAIVGYFEVNSDCGDETAVAHGVSTLLSDEELAADDPVLLAIVQRLQEVAPDAHMVSER